MVITNKQSGTNVHEVADGIHCCPVKSRLRALQASDSEDDLPGVGNQLILFGF